MEHKGSFECNEVYYNIPIRKGASQSKTHEFCLNKILVYDHELGNIDSKRLNLP